MLLSYVMVKSPGLALLTHFWKTARNLASWEAGREACNVAKVVGAAFESVPEVIVGGRRSNSDEVGRDNDSIA